MGARVMSIGYPHAVDTPMEGEGLHVTARTTSAAGTVSKRLGDVLQIDSYAGKGSSGSPVFDADGARLRLALSVFGRVGRLNTAPDGPVASLMVEAARSLAAELHGQRATNGVR